jgi:[protein-PII] uridylyltransferase
MDKSYFGQTVKTLSPLRQEFESRLNAAVALHRKGAGGIRIALVLSGHYDWFLQSIFRELSPEEQKSMTVVALGGYGRNELCFSSDVDIMFLIADDAAKVPGATAAQNFLHRLLDAGIDVAHSFRTIRECLDIAKTDIEPCMSLMEARFICGSRKTFAEYRKQMQREILNRNPKEFVRTLNEMRKLRHAKYGSSATLLEPNVKNSAGGLRDLHTVLWLMYGTGLCKIPPRLKGTTAIVLLLSTPALKRVFFAAFLKQTKAAFDFLLRTRNEMHLQSKSLHDVLEFGFQRQCAAGLHYRPTARRTSVEHFMQDYHSAAKDISRFSARLVAWAIDEWSVERPAFDTRVLNNELLLRSGKLQFRAKPARINNEFLLRAFIACCQYDAKFSFQLEDAVHKKIAKLGPLRTKTEAELFRTLLKQTSGVAGAFHSIANLGLLERWIPEWKPMVSFFQHNQYHFYTADEHTLIAVDSIEALQSSDTSFGAVFRSLPERDVLYLACIFHDIAKPMHIGKHEINGAKIAKRVLRRLRCSDIEDDVAFLVRQHLAMEQVAFRRNVNDPQTIVQFARRFKSAVLLSYLYVLTYADLSAVNSTVWTKWKESLLNELYRKTFRVLEEHLTGEEVHRRAKEQASEQEEKIIGQLARQVDEQAVRRHLTLIEETAYLAVFTAEEIGQHISALDHRDGVRSLFRDAGNFTEVTILTSDAPYALSKFCGVLTANDADIFDAQIFTRSDGTIIDKFRVVDFISKSSLSPEIQQKITEELQDVMTGKIDIDYLLERHRLRWKRRAQPANPNIRRDVEFESHPRFTIIDVYAADSLGFLHKLTTTMSGLGLNISFAKIATRVDGIVDSFYVVDRNGNKIDDPPERDRIRDTILKTIQELAESELVNSPT